MRLQQTYQGSEAQRFALEPPPYGAGWPGVAYDAKTLFVYEKEPYEPGSHFYLLLGYDGKASEVARTRLEGWGERRADCSEALSYWPPAPYPSSDVAMPDQECERCFTPPDLVSGGSPAVGESVCGQVSRNGHLLRRPRTSFADRPPLQA